MTAGYSGTPLAQKLGIKEGHRVAIVDGPRGFAGSLAVPTGARVLTGLPRGAAFDVLVMFATSRAAIARRLAALRARMTPAAGLWLAWPKRASGVATDVTEHVLRELALPTGLVDNKVCAIDATWSGLRFVVRVELR